MTTAAFAVTDSPVPSSSPAPDQPIYQGHEATAAMSSGERYHDYMTPTRIATQPNMYGQYLPHRQTPYPNASNAPMYGESQNLFPDGRGNMLPLQALQDLMQQTPDLEWAMPRVPPGMTADQVFQGLLNSHYVQTLAPQIRTPKHKRFHIRNWPTPECPFQAEWFALLGDEQQRWIRRIRSFMPKEQQIATMSLEQLFTELMATITLNKFDGFLRVHGAQAKPDSNRKGT